MKAIKTFLLFVSTITGVFTQAQDFSVKSPDDKIVVNIGNSEKLTYSVIFNGQTIVDRSSVGFEFKDEEPMTGNFTVIDQKRTSISETWSPVVKSKHASVINSH